MNCWVEFPYSAGVSSLWDADADVEFVASEESPFAAMINVERTRSTQREIASLITQLVVLEPHIDIPTFIIADLSGLKLGCGPLLSRRVWLGLTLPLRRAAASRR